MKRSEMLKIIRKSIIDYEYDFKLQDVELGKFILEKIEKLGMTPPEYLPEPKYCEITGKQLECKPIREWEKE